MKNIGDLFDENLQDMFSFSVTQYEFIHCDYTLKIEKKVCFILLMMILFRGNPFQRRQILLVK